MSKAHLSRPMAMNSMLLATLCAVTLGGPSSGVAAAQSAAQSQTPSPANAAVGMSNVRTERWQLGVTVRAHGTMTGIVATLPVPMSWPEQDVKIVARQQSRQVRSVRFRELDKSVQQMSISIPRLAAGEEAQALITMEITKRDIVAPVSTDQLTLPRKPRRDLVKYLKPSPYIDSKDPVIVRSAEQAIAGKERGWEQAEAIYDWVRDKIEYRFDRKIKSARKALDDGYGDCEEMTSLFIAMCRAVGIPARAVWIPGHCYPEFYLEDEQGVGHWYPCQAAGSRFFGAMPEARPILQKGDNFRVPGSRKPQRYVQETLAAKNAAAPPEVTFIRTKLE